MPVEVPTPSQLRKIADKVGLHLSDGDVGSFIELMRPTIGAYNAATCRRFAIRARRVTARRARRTSTMHGT